MKLACTQLGRRMFSHRFVLETVLEHFACRQLGSCRYEQLLYFQEVEEGEIASVPASPENLLKATCKSRRRMHILTETVNIPSDGGV